MNHFAYLIKNDISRHENAQLRIDYDENEFAICILGSDSSARDSKHVIKEV